MTMNQAPTSSRKIVIARHVSVTANQAFSYSCSTSIGRSGPYRSFCRPKRTQPSARRIRFVRI